MAAHSTESTTASALDQHASPVSDHRTASGAKNGMAVAAMIVGILAIPAIIVPILAIILGVVAIVLGAVARSRAKSGGMSGSGQAMAGIVCGAIGIVGAVAIIALAVSGSGAS
ncbi:DUF4190 domain-containing protein [Solirubrobacter sp. CPCC 204708]|uniref:DUF4190 domain-containing protein n=1 Tax=Solirubrobacter deserti TaxID=2282478 RepID=A0ABT4RGS6_9ACTN|nr:DUF4190 domain-containing protein [Solirubrobacter deserti]MBE2315475.1 DUF4190 domain-containing protein [Solirubrobacter deserti]MDA0137683.1 DUF4190 domain-containing protein [Solirubrobacter deserti]